MLKFIVCALCVNCILGYPQSPSYSYGYSSVKVQKPVNKDLQFQSYLIDPQSQDKEKNLIPADEVPFEDESTTVKNETTTETSTGSTTELFVETTTELFLETTTESFVETTTKEYTEEEGSGFKSTETDKNNTNMEEQHIKTVLNFQSYKLQNLEASKDANSPTTTDMYFEIIDPDIDINKKSISKEGTTENNMETTTSTNEILTTTIQNDRELTTKKPCNNTDPDIREIDEPEYVFPEMDNSRDNEIEKEIQTNHELAEEFEVENKDIIGVNVNNVNPQFVDFIYYIYNPSGYFQRVTTYNADNSETLSQSSQYKSDNAEPIRELAYAFRPDLLIFQRFTSDV